MSSASLLYLHTVVLFSLITLILALASALLTATSLSLENKKKKVPNEDLVLNKHVNCFNGSVGSDLSFAAGERGKDTM